MKLEQHTPEVTETSRLYQVTPLSKYLAMVLFVILPFVGGYIGYTFAPEKVVEVEKVVVKEVPVICGIHASDPRRRTQPFVSSSPTEADAAAAATAAPRGEADSEWRTL